MELNHTTTKITRKSTVKGNTNIINTTASITLEGSYNRIVADTVCPITVNGTQNTVYGKGTVVVSGRWNVASTLLNESIYFERENDLPVEIKIDNKQYMEGKPYCLIDDTVYEVYRYNKVPYIVKNKQSIEIEGTPLTKCEVRGPLSTKWYMGILDKYDHMWKGSDINRIYKFIEQSDLYGGLVESELVNAIINTIKTTQTITRTQFMVATNACDSGIDRVINRWCDRKFIPECIKEGKEIPLNCVIDAFNKDLSYIVAVEHYIAFGSFLTALGVDTSAYNCIRRDC